MTDISRVVCKLQQLRDQLPSCESAIVGDLMKAAGVVETTPVQFNPYLPNVHTNPYSQYHRIQAENPVHWSEAMQAWIISRYADVVSAFRDSRLSYRTGLDTMMACVPEEEQAGVRAVTNLLGSLLNEVDPPEHTRLRGIMNRALAAAKKPQQASHIEAVANELIDAVYDQGEMDVVGDYAYPLPAMIGADLLDIPGRDREKFQAWVHDITHTFSEGFSGTAAMARGDAAVVQLTSYILNLLAERREHPGDDFLTATTGDSNVTEEERALIAINTIMGMHENITHAISLAVNTILRSPALLTKLVATSENFPQAVEEMLRHEGTAPILSRVAVEDITIGDVTIPKGQRVILLVAAANRDTERFPDPDSFDLGRERNPHVAFGVGRRACPGAGLARTMLHISVRTLLLRLPDLRLVDEEPVWREEINIHGLRELRVKFTPPPVSNAPPVGTFGTK